MDPSVDDNDAPSSAPAAPQTHAPRRSMVLVVFFTVLALDQLTKWWAVEELSNRRVDVVWTLVLHKVENRGAAFSLFGSGGMGPVIGVVALSVVGFLLWQGRSVRSWWGALALGLVAGGALGNLLDRLFRARSGFLTGGVIDWIDFQWWPVFNVADMGVVVGGILLGIVYAFAPEDGVEPDPDGDGSDTGLEPADVDAAPGRHPLDADASTEPLTDPTPR